MTSTHSARRNNARLLCIETLENRELLSVTAAEFAQIRADNADLNLSANMANYNVIEITAANLSDTAIHNAIAKAGTTTESDLIVLRTTATRNKITLGGSELEIDIDASKWGSVTLVGFGTNLLTLDANQGSRIYNIADGAKVGLAGQVITNGHSPFGGGIYNTGTLAVTHSTLSNNSAVHSGGGIENYGTLTVTHSALSNNSASDILDADGMGRGGGICNGGGSVTITNSAISENDAHTISGYAGGGIYTWGGHLTITKSTISKNWAENPYQDAHGGGLAVLEATVILNQVDFIENLSTASTYGYGDGGGLYLNDSTATVTNSTFQGNSAWGVWGAQGGGCYTWDTAATFTNCVFVGNDASDDGSGASDYLSTGYLSTGGGMSQAGGTVTLTNVTIAGNRATEYGAGYYVDGRNGATAATTYIRNSIVALNTGISEQYHTSQGGTTHENNNLKTDPKFVQNPGSIGSENYGNLQLQSSSPAVNKGNNTYVSGVTTDILGNTRIANGTVDIGAYEYGSTPVIQKPATPIGLTSSSQTVNSVTLTWTAVNTATSYTLQIKGGAFGNTFVDVPSANGGAAKTGTTATVTGLAASTVYQFQLKANNASGSSAYTAAVSATTKAVTPPAAPPTVTYTQPTADSVKLNWDKVDGATSYYVYRSADGGKTYQAVASNIAEITWTDTNVANGSYIYIVRAFNNAGRSDASNPVNVTVDSTAPAKLATPTNLTATPTGNGAKLTWNAVPNAAAYKIYRSADNGKTFILVSTRLAKNFNGQSPYFNDTTAVNSGSYIYAIRAYDAKLSNATRSDEVTAKVTVTSAKLAKPTSLTATAAKNGAKLTWGAVDGAAAYKIYRSADNGKTFTLVSTRLAKNFNGKTPYFDDVAGSGSYIYAIRAYDASLSNVTRSDEVTATVTV